MRPVLLFACLAMLVPPSAQAHSSDQVFVLLLPTGIYSAAGVAVVVLTMMIMAARPRLLEAAGAGEAVRDIPPAIWSSNIAATVLAALLALGWLGPPGALQNLLPLAFWTLWWICLPLVQPGLDLWRWINPWTGPLSFWKDRHLVVLPGRWGRWPAVPVFIAFALFELADIAPDDPRRLAVAVALYWLFTALMCLIFGVRVWLDRGEAFSIFFASLHRLLRRTGQVRHPVSTGVLFLTILAAGSFDGLKDTFLWLDLIGINPLAFPGRSAVVQTTALGLGAAILALSGAFYLAAHLGRGLSGLKASPALIFGALAQSVLPIALGYHFAHFLTALLVQGQYLLVALGDPFGTGADLLGLGPHFVSTGFFYDQRLVRILWLTQAGAVVGAHVWAVLLAHRTGLSLAGDSRQAVRLQLPLSLLMVAYTMFGLWLLAAPRGV